MSNKSNNSMSGDSSGYGRSDIFDDLALNPSRNNGLISGSNTINFDNNPLANMVDGQIGLHRFKKSILNEKDSDTGNKMQLIASNDPSLPFRPKSIQELMGASFGDWPDTQIDMTSTTWFLGKQSLVRSQIPESDLPKPLRETVQELNCLLEQQKNSEGTFSISPVCAQSLQFLADNWWSANAYNWAEKTHKVPLIKYLTSRMKRASISLKVRDKSKVKDDAVSSAMEEAMKPKQFQTKVASEVTTVINPLAGESASGWDTDMTDSLHCVALRSVDMQAIIPDFHRMVQEVFASVRSCEVARFIFESIEMPNRTDLTEFSSATHISQYLFSPWLPVFLALRDLLSLGETRTITTNTDASRPLPFDSSLDRERKLENMSEQLLHRFMEVTLLLFSIICNERDEFRSTPSRTGGFSQIGLCKCEILDDGYIYVARQTTNGAGNQYGRTPVIRFEAKRKEKSDTGSAMPQIFSELLSAAALNRKYDNAGYQSGDRLDRKEDRSHHHDAFVIQVRHYTLTIHTARFPSEYLRWVTGDVVDAEFYKESRDGYAIIHKESTGYDLSKKDGRREALKNILTLLWTIKFPGTDKSGIHVARVRGKTGPAK